MQCNKLDSLSLINIKSKPVAVTHCVAMCVQIVALSAIRFKQRKQLSRRNPAKMKYVKKKRLMDQR